MVEQQAAVRTLAFTIGKTFDLDGLGRRYVVAPDPAFSDITLKRSTRGIFYGVRLSPIHGAKLSLGQGNNRTKAQCRSARYNSGSINMTAGMAGKYVCVKTNSGHYGKMRIVGMSANTTKVRYTHW